jgi:hypothetical protein
LKRPFFTIRRGLERYEIWLPIILGLVFLFISVLGISWGTPDLWHPDELVRRVIQALNGEWVFDEANFDYPSLPKYVMFGVGKFVSDLGYPREAVIIAARFISAVLGALVVGLTYRITRLVGGHIAAACLAALLLISNSEFVLNAHWAHNDIYLTFFVCLSVYGLVKYSLLKGRLWLYLSFFSAGLAASSKYNGGIIVIAPVLIYLFDQRRMISKDFLRIMETFFIGVVLSVLGYVIGTPKSILWLAFYLKRLIPALLRHSIYGSEPGREIGLLRQWDKLHSVWGTLVNIWVLAALVYVVILLFKEFASNRDLKPEHNALLSIVVALIALDLPILLSYNVQPRFFLPMLPLFAVLASLLALELIAYVQLKGYRFLAYVITGAIVLLITYSSLRVLSVSLLLTNDSRIAASDFVHNLPLGSTIEYTIYPPSIPRENFSNSHNFPLVFIKVPDQILPTSKHYEFNVGEVGIEDRQPDYLIVDSFTVDRFKNVYICDLHRLDCDFFNRLKDGKTNYQLIAGFEYRLPDSLPDLKVSFVNPDLYVYQRLID